MQYGLNVELCIQPVMALAETAKFCEIGRNMAKTRDPAFLRILRVFEYIHGMKQVCTCTCSEPCLCDLEDLPSSFFYCSSGAGKTQTAHSEFTIGSCVPAFAHT